MAFPVSPSTGKGGKVFVNAGDGVYLSGTAMTKQASHTYKGETYTDRIYTLGAGKTLINMRPAKEPSLVIDGIVSEVTISGTGSNDEVSTSAFDYMYNGTRMTASADSSVSVSRPAATQGAWVAIHVKKSDGSISATKGTDTSDAGGITGLLDTYGTGAGQRPLIATTELLIGWLKLTNGAAAVASTEIFYNDQERYDTLAWTWLPNIGGVMLNAALVALHTGDVARDVKFTGYYLDDSFTQIGTAKDWSLTPSVNTVSETTMGGSASQSEIGGWTFSFAQLACDEIVKNAMLNRQGMLAVRLMYPNGGYWQGVGSGAGSFKCAAGAFNSIDVSGSLADDPVFS